MFLWLVSKVLLSWHREVVSESVKQVSLPVTSQAACATQLDRQFAMSGKTPCRGHQYIEDLTLLIKVSRDIFSSCHVHVGGGVFNSCPPEKDSDHRSSWPVKGRSSILNLTSVVLTNCPHKWQLAHTLKKVLEKPLMDTNEASVFYKRKS